MVFVEHGPATWSKEAGDLGYGPGDVEVVQHPFATDDVECSIGQIGCFGRRHEEPDIGAGPMMRDQPAGQLNLANRGIQRGDRGAGVDEPDGQLATAAAKLQHAPAGQRSHRGKQVFE